MKLRVALVALSAPLIISLANVANAATYYVSTSGSDSSNGQSSSAAIKTPQVAASKLRAGDSLLLRRGDTFVTNKAINVAHDNITIGAYGSGSRPIIDWRMQSLGTWNGAVHVTANNATVRDLDIRNVGGLAVRFMKVKGGLMDNVRSDWSYVHAFQAFRSEGITFRNSESIRNNGGWKYHGESTWGNGISVVTSKNIVVENNIVREGWGEGIDSFYGSENVTIQDNIVYASRAVGIYVDSTRGAIVRRNIVLGTKESAYHRNDGLVGGGIVLNNESYQFEEHGGRLTKSSVASDIKIYDNLVAGTAAGFSLWGQYPSSMYSNIVVSNNTFIDNKAQIALLNTATGGGNVVANNIFISTDSRSRNVGGTQSAGGFSFHSNYWSDRPGSVAQGSGDVIGGTRLAKMSGWRDITAWNQVTYKDFVPSDSSSVWGSGSNNRSWTDGMDYLAKSWSGAVDIGSFSKSGSSVSPPVELRVSVQ